jgi:ATP-dependent Clp protease ATP-binding subunit ClpC
MPTIFGRFSQNCEAVLIKAQQLSIELNRPMQSDMVLLAVLTFNNITAQELMKGAGVTYDKLLPNLEPITEQANLPSSTNLNPPQTLDMQLLLEEAIRYAARYHFMVVEVEHLVLVITSLNKLTGFRLLIKSGIQPDRIANRLREWLISVALISQHNRFNENTEAKQATNERPTERESLEKYVFDVTEAASKNALDPVIGRETELEEIIHILLRRRKSNPLLIGEPGVGKTTLVDGLAQKIASKDVPAALVNKRVLTLDLGLVVAGTIYRGQFEERLKDIIQEVISRGDCILFIDEMHTLTGAGSSEGSFDAANILKPALARGEITIIGATTHEEYRKHIMKDKALDRRFQTLTIEEPSIKESIRMLKGLRKGLEKHHHVIITDEVIKAAVELSNRYIHDRLLPDKAIDVLDQAATFHAEPYVADQELEELQREITIISTQKTSLIEQAVDMSEWDLAKELSDKETQLMQKLQKLQKLRQINRNIAQPVEIEHIAMVIASRLGIPVHDIRQNLEPMDIQKMRQTLEKYILGQNEAIQKISQSLLRYQLGLSPAKKPIGSFLLVGPTGVGKTETARVLAREIFADPKALIKIDMSEYMERHTVSNLIGAPAGYIGFDQGGSLTEQVRRRPFAVVLFDEVEKAHPDVFHILLQILEDGVLTDNTGNIISFEHTLIVMTSNIGMESFNQAAKIGFDTTELNEADLQTKNQIELNEHIGEEIQDFFRPELLGRLTGVIYYRALGKEVVKKLFQHRLLELKKLLKTKGVELKNNPKLLDWLVNQYDPESGARSIDRIFLNEVEPEVISQIVENPEVKELHLEIKDAKLKVKSNKV